MRRDNIAFARLNHDEESALSDIEKRLKVSRSEAVRRAIIKLRDLLRKRKAA